MNDRNEFCLKCKVYVIPTSVMEGLECRYKVDVELFLSMTGGVKITL